MLFKRILIAGALLLAAISQASSQGSQFPAGTIWGNDTAAQRGGKVSTVTSILDRALGSTRGAILERGASGWAIIGPSATAGLPFVSAGAGADPLYQRLGLVGGGTNADLSATGGASQFLRQNSTGAAITVVQPAFTDISGRNTLAQLPQGIANSIFINPTGSTANMQNVAVPACANDGAHALVYVNASGLQCATIAAATISLSLTQGVTGATNPITSTGDIRIDVSFLQNYLSGLTMANGVDATNDILVNPGVAADSTNAVLIKLTSALEKRTDASWAVGNGNGCWDTGAVANGTIHWWLIRRSDTGVVDVLCSASPSSPTMPASYDSRRRIGSIVRIAAALQLFNQIGNNFYLNAPFSDDTTAALTTASLTITLDAIPTGINTIGKLKFYAITSAASTTIYVRPLFMDDVAAAATGTANIRDQSAGLGSTTELDVPINTSAQFAARAAAAVTTFNTIVRGWVDTRGQ